MIATTTNLPTRRPRMSPTGRSGGFTLIELMIAITISLLILLALSAVWVNVVRTNREMANINSQIESGRFAIQVLQEDIAHAGFWGSYVPQFDNLALAAVPSDVPSAVPAPCLAYTAVNWTNVYKANLLGVPLDSYDAVPAGCTAVVTDKKDDTDVLVLRHAETCIPGTGDCDADTAGKLYFQSSLCASDPSSYVLDTAGYTLHKKDCTTIADKRKFISNIYYVRTYVDEVGDAIPTLVRSEFDLSAGTLKQQDPVALVEGIEGFNVEFGIDSISDSGAAANYGQAVVWANAENKTSPTNRGDGNADGGFIHCTATTPCTAAQLMNAVEVKIYVLARSVNPTPGYIDNKTYKLGSVTLGPFNNGYKRHVFSSTVRLNNVSGRRETP